MKEVFWFIATVIIGLFVIFALVSVPLYFVRQARCDSIKVNGTNSKYTGLITGCFVEVNGEFIPQENWREV